MTGGGGCYKKSWFDIMKSNINSVFECLSFPLSIQKSTYTPKVAKIIRIKHRKRAKLEIKKAKQYFQPKVLKNYKLYIKSKYWVKRRSRHFKKFGYKCVICGSNKELNVHHLYYGNFSSELDDDLVTFCRDHHELFHSQFDTQKDMRAITNQFIIEQSEIESFPVI